MATITHVTSDRYLAVAEQAALLGITPDYVRKLRDRFGPDSSHPYPAEYIGGRWLADRAALLAWDAARPKGDVARTGRPRTRPDSVTIAQWRDLTAIAGGAAIRGDKATTRRLAALGLVTAPTPDKAVLTPAGRSLIEEWSQ